MNKIKALYYRFRFYLKLISYFFNPPKTDNIKTVLQAIDELKRFYNE